MLVLRVYKGGDIILLSILMASVMCLYFGMQEKDIFEHTNGKCRLCTFLVNL